ncbi:MAG TPA: glycosyltransferase family 1 protein [Candidatus Limnocylindria bacterium]|jgi:alpha-1,3-rhamnosyl/mannosyltransferase|nr:glycosyltransferase family 1 protein [Candidatus Limnocylindria bacterium]
MSVVHVAVDAHNLVRDDRGIGRYARAVLARALRVPGFRWSLVVRDLFPKRGTFARALDAAAVTVTRRVPRDADVVWFPWNGTFLRTALPTVATVHDAAPFAFPAANPRIREAEQGPFRATAASAKRILVQSAFTAAEVQRWLGVAPDRIVVTPLAVDPIFTPGPADGLPVELRGRRYVLHVGAHDPRKNTATLVAAHERAFPDGEVTLAFTRTPPAMPRGGVVVEARDDATLVALYRGAALVALPSTYEGFGFPLLEAMACGAPALAARAGALPEIGAEAAAYVERADDVAAWSDALRTLLADDVRLAELAANGPARAASFSWERCTAQTLAVLRATANAEAA